MPLLRKETEIFPEDLFDLPDGLLWRVVHMRSRQEKALARILLRQGVAFYLPQFGRTTLRSGRRFVSYLPLFPGYVFVRGGAETRDIIWRTDLAARILDVDDQELFGSELRQIRQLQEAGASLTPLDEIVPGDRVQIREGAFQGYVGIVLRHGRAARLVVAVSLIHRSVAVEFDPSMIARSTSRAVPQA